MTDEIHVVVNPADLEEWLTVAEAAVRLGVASPTTIHYHIARGRLETVKRGGLLFVRAADLASLPRQAGYPAGKPRRTPEETA